MNRRATLSFEQLNTICRALIPIGDRVWEYATRLIEVGFSAFLPYEEFVASFAADTEELQVHRQYVCEIAKARLGRPRPLRATREQESLLYYPALLSDLRARRDELNGVSPSEFSLKYPDGKDIWRIEIDPCERRKVFLSIVEPETYEIRWREMLRRTRDVFSNELAQHSTELDSEFGFSKQGRIEFYSAIMARDAAQRGFNHDRDKSYPDYPVFSKPLSAQWDICFVIENSWDFGTPAGGLAEIVIEIRSHRLRGNPANAAYGEYLEIPHRHLIPGFGNAYWKFGNLRELETIVRANLHFYSLIAEFVEHAVKMVIDGE